MSAHQFQALTRRSLSRILSLSAKLEMPSLVAYVDGGSLGNPGPAGIGVVIDGAENGTIKITKSMGVRITTSLSTWPF